MENEMTLKEKVIAVLEESIRCGREVNFVYESMNVMHKRVSEIEKFSRTMQAKVELFKNMDEKAYTFSRIVDTAKLALKKLQSNKGYNYYCAELILKFFQIEDLFKRKLRPVGLRDVEKKVNGHIQTLPILSSEEAHKYYEQSEDEKHEEYFQNERIINEDVNGRALNKQIKKEKDVYDTLGGASFND